MRVWGGYKKRFRGQSLKRVACEDEGIRRVEGSILEVENVCEKGLS
jgi:hypothetical protein